MYRKKKDLVIAFFGNLMRQPCSPRAVSTPETRVFLENNLPFIAYDAVGAAVSLPVCTLDLVAGSEKE